MRHVPIGLAVAFVGAVVPDEPRYRSAAFNRAGNNFQLQLVRGLMRQGVSHIEVFSARPIAAWPRSSSIWVAASSETIASAAPLHLLPFPNVTPLKQIVIGLGVLVGLLGWGWRMRSSRNRLVLTYNLSVPPGLFTLLGARLVGAKAMVSVNDIYVSGKTIRPSLLRRLDVLLQRWLLPQFDGYIAVSDHIAREFFPDRAYIRVEGGVDDAFLDRTRRTDMRRTLPDAPLVLAYAGELDQTNGIPVLLGALGSDGLPNVRLRLAGSGPLRRAVEEAARRDARVEYLGLLDHAGVAALYKSADLLLNLRQTKAMDTRFFFPSKLIEYLASGVPTITTATAHVTEEFDGLVYVLEDETIDGLVRLLSLVASKTPDERAAMGARARAYAETYKTWDAQSARVVTYLRDVVFGRELDASSRDSP